MLVKLTTVEEEDLTSTINFILDRKLKVDVVTFSNVHSPSLLNLTPFGAVYASEFGAVQIIRDTLFTTLLIVTLFITLLLKKLVMLSQNP